MRRLSPALLGLLIAASARAATPHAYVAPWLAVPPGDARVARIAELPVGAPSPNAPGVLLKLGAADWTSGRPAATAAVLELAEHAHGAGWKWGLKLDLPDAAVPADVRAAEAATVEELWPGLGEILGNAKTADVVLISLAAPAGADAKARAYLLRKVSAGARAAAPQARISFAASPGAPPDLLSADARLLLSEENTAYLDLIALAGNERTTPSDVRAAIDSVAFGKPGVVDLDGSV